MPLRRINFEKDQLVHVASRAVEERKIFKTIEDCYRFIFQIFAANVGRPSLNLDRGDAINTAKALLAGEDVPSEYIRMEHSPLVHILDFSLVVNHYHLFLVATNKNSIPLFMKKLNGGFAMYFNLKYGRRGSLFGSRYKSTLIDTEFQAHAVSRYISIINPLDVYRAGWREAGLNETESAFNFLRDYQFSSFPDKIGNRESKILAPKKIFTEFGLDMYFDRGEYRKFVEEFLEGRLSSYRSRFID